MLKHLKPSAAMIVAIISLFVALTGGAVAAGFRISGTQINDNSITKAKLTPSLRKIIMDGSQPGPPGLDSVNGAPGGFDPGKLSYWTGADVPVDPGGLVFAQAWCPPGAYATGGGWISAGNNFASFAVLGGTGWQIGGVNDLTVPITVTAFVVCAAR